MTSFIYILRCENDKYYVGISSNISAKFLEHKYGDKIEWTSKYRPIEIIDIIEDYDVDRYLKMYMRKYGIENVRGESYEDVELNEEIKKYLENLIK